MYEIICNVWKENHVSKELILTGTLKRGHENVLTQENLWAEYSSWRLAREFQKPKMKQKLTQEDIINEANPVENKVSNK